MQNKRFTSIDLFAGCGGLTEGLRQAGFRTLAAVELDPTAADTYRLNHRRVNLLNDDIRRVDPERLRRELGLGRGELDLMAGCPPCQGFSSLRTRNGGRQNRDARNGLVREMLRFVDSFVPSAVMMENVPGLEGKSALVDFVAGLTDLGYRARVQVHDARHFGVPQRRRRLILLAGRGFDIPFASEITAQRTVRDAIGSLPRAGKSGDALHDLPENRSPKIRELISRIPRNGGSRAALGPEAQLQCHRNCEGFRDIYGRMAWNAVAPTITGGCFNPSKGRFLHPEHDRCITMREAALLQSFPLNYRFDIAAGKQAIALMIGNALPPEFIRQQALAVKKAIQASAA
jgi:DNA (cytosine-5)-methyltransferase 1